jgi:3-hydroxyacyl-[acyl-carrier-protein] dehydratase
MRLEYFQMIDRITGFERDGSRLTAESTAPEESPVFDGHFPDYPLMPGVLLIETMAQASGYLLLGLNDFARMPFLAGVDKAKLRRFVEPKTPMRIDAALVHEGSGYAVTKARIAAEGKAACDAELMFKILPFPAGLGERMRKHAAGLGLPVTEVRR